jgi:putative transposase
MAASLGKSELARRIQDLKAENEILRAKLPKRVTVTPTERRRLTKLGQKIGPALSGHCCCDMALPYRRNKSAAGLRSAARRGSAFRLTSPPALRSSPPSSRPS